MSRNTSIIDGIYNSAVSHTVILTAAAAHTEKRRLSRLAVSLTANRSLMFSNWGRVGGSSGDYNRIVLLFLNTNIFTEAIFHVLFHK